MHYIDRSQVPPPHCLAGFRHGRDTWDDLDDQHRAEIHAQLKQMNGRRCAYCEGDLDTWGQHIEHFRPRSHAPALTFDWSNLFWSCEQEDCCGKHKDGSSETRVRPYAPEDLIKPDAEDPEHFLLFISDGTIQVRAGLSERERHRAEETLRVFNLDRQHGRLRKMRSLAIKFYGDMNLGVIEFLNACSAEDRDAFLREEIRATSRAEFATAIKHFLQQGLSSDRP